MRNPVKITPDMDSIVLSGKNTAQCTVTECNKESMAFDLDAVEENQDGSANLYEAINYGRNVKKHADYIYVGKEGEAIIELKRLKSERSDVICSAKEQISATLNYLEPLKTDYTALKKRFNDRTKIKKIIIIQFTQKRSKPGKKAYEWESVKKSIPNLFKLKLLSTKRIQEAKLLRLNS